MFNGKLPVPILSEGDNDNEPRSVPTTFHIRDVITLLTIAVGIASAFFMYGSRVAILEKQHEQDEIFVQQLQAQDKLDIQALNSQQREIDFLKDQIDLVKETKRNK